MLTRRKLLMRNSLKREGRWKNEFKCPLKRSSENACWCVTSKFEGAIDEAATIFKFRSASFWRDPRRSQECLALRVRTLHYSDVPESMRCIRGT